MLLSQKHPLYALLQLEVRYDSQRPTVVLLLWKHRSKKLFSTRQRHKFSLGCTYVLGISEAVSGW